MRRRHAVPFTHVFSPPSTPLYFPFLSFLPTIFLFFLSETLLSWYNHSPPSPPLLLLLLLRFKRLRDWDERSEPEHGHAIYMVVTCYAAAMRARAITPGAPTDEDIDERWDIIRAAMLLRAARHIRDAHHCLPSLLFLPLVLFCFVFHALYVFRFSFSCLYTVFI